LSTTDPRLEALHDWLAARFGRDAYELAPASADASFRRYFRVTHDGESWIAMDAPPSQENCRPFVQVAALLHAAGVHVPQILAHDLKRGYLLLSDLGTKTYLDVINPVNADELFRNAIEALIKWQLASRPEVLPSYDEPLLQREMSLFPEWYVAKHLKFELTAAQQQVLSNVMSLLVKSALAQPSVYVHRDYMPRNLMLSRPNPGVLDFQDAVYGPITYDVVSLFRDAFLSWPEERVLDWSARYWESARAACLPVHADFGDFWRNFEWMGLQRHLKVLGIFARINYRDGKPHYLKDTPRFVAYVRAVANRYREFGPLLKLFDELESIETRAGYTF
jgi:N-acetylmuramate 1-kinase